MKASLLFLVLIAISSHLVAAPPAQDFLAAKSKYATAGHAKAKGLVMTLEYPTSWTAKEGERPNIVQKFVSPSRLEMAAIITKALPLPAGTKIPEQELKEFFTPTEMKEMLPEGATLIAAKATKIEGLPAGIMEYSMRQERAGMTADMRFVAFIFVHGTTMVQLQCSVVAPVAQSASLPQRMTEFMPLFTLMANSIVLPDKWK